MLASSESERPPGRPSRRWSLVVVMLLLTLLAHLLVLHWLNEQLQSIAFFEDDDDDGRAISVSLLRPPSQQAPPPRKSSSVPTPSPVQSEAPAKPIATPAEALDKPTPGSSPSADVTAAPTAPTAPEPAPAAAATAPASSGSSSTPTASTPLPTTEPPPASSEPPASATAEAPSSSEPALPNISALFDKANPPPPAELRFNAVGVRKDGRSLSGSGTMHWRHDGQRYSLETEITALMFTLAKNRSEGEFGSLGIAPNLYVEKRFGRSETNTHFQHQSKLISFSASTATIPSNGGEQDRGSWIWQLASLGRGDPGKFEAGLHMEMLVASARGVDAWRIKISGKEQLKLADGEVSTWRLSVIPGAQSFDKQFDLWLAPDRQWYPVRLLHEDKSGNRIELSLTKISAK